MLPNDPALPQLTVAFQLVRERSSVSLEFFPAFTIMMLHHPPVHTIDSTHIHLDVEHPISSNTSFLSVPLNQSRFLRTAVSSSSHPPQPDGTARKDCISTRIVRVVPIHHRTRPEAPIHSLPTEILMYIFDLSFAFYWQHDLLSFAQVCRRWSTCAMKILFTHLESPEWRNRCVKNSKPFFHEFAKALIETPALGLDIQRLRLDQHSNPYHWCSNGRIACPGFNSALLTILSSTKHLQHLTLMQGYLRDTNKLFLSLPKLHSLRTLSITRIGCESEHQAKLWSARNHWFYSVSSFQLGCCMARLPGLTSLTVTDLKPGNIGMARRFFMRPPSCALTHLCIRNSDLSDKDLLYLTASSAKSLEQVTLDKVVGFTHSGLCAFLESVAHNLISLTIRAFCGSFALDQVVAQMSCLEVLNIHGDLASECMFRRRSERFVRSYHSGDARIPVVQITAHLGPHIEEFTADEWPGWEVIEFDFIH
ncbi:hypothetical protein JVU11DRAFT_10421 [Chiua virens]|nr:hypothetical protein JVU11DRAFT_10421 [Chiua virens]